MANLQSNIWLVYPETFEPFTFTGGKIVYITEEAEPIFRTHPAIITASALLPPIEAIQAELDGRMFESVTLYEQYLQQEEADPYISILVAAAIRQIPIGIMFGKEEMESLKFPMMFIDFLYKAYGLVVGIPEKIKPAIMEQALPFDLGKLYSMNIIDAKEFMLKHPNLPMHPLAMSKLIYDFNPAVKEKNLQSYTEYFQQWRAAIAESGKFLMDPMVAL